MANLALILNNISEALGASKIYYTIEIKPIKQELYFYGETKDFNYSVYYDFTKSKYCISYSLKVKTNKNKESNSTVHFSFPREVVEYINNLKKG